MSPETARPRAGTATLARLSRRLNGQFDIDEWGLDPELVATVDPWISLRWDVEVTEAQRIPAAGGAVLAFNRRFGISEPWVLARGIRRSSGRFVRTVGVADHAPVGPFLRRFGAVMDRPEEIEGLLRAGQLVGLPMSRQLPGRETAGSLDVSHVDAALAAGAPVIPVALVGREIGRHWRVVVGKPVRSTGDGPRAAAQLADRARVAVQELLDESVPAGWWL